MKASQLVKELQKLISQYGDYEVVESYDARTVEKVEITTYDDDSGTHDVIGLELSED